MLLKRGIKISTHYKNRLNWLHKWATWAMADGKTSVLVLFPAIKSQNPIISKN